MTTFTKKVRPIAMVAAAAAVLLTACAKSADTTSPSSGGGGAGAGGSSVAVTTATVAGMGTVLVDSKGATLYYLKMEKPGTIKCTGACAAAWPPLLLPAGATAAGGSGISAGDLGTIDRPDGGTQVTYQGMPLYTFASDQRPGQATGQGVSGFFVVTTSGSGSMTPSESPSSSGYGRGY